MGFRDLCNARAPIAIATLFAIGTSVLAYDNARTSDLAPRFHWPDETSNAFFATRVARGEPLVVQEPRNVASGNLIHPRTVNVRVDGALVPGAYLGMPLWYGFIGRVIGERGMLFVTPVLAALGLLAFARIIRRYAGATTALLTIVLLALHPSLWLTTTATFLPNMPFIALLLCGFAALLGGTSWLRWGMVGILLGFALTMRTHELLWVAALVAAVIWWQRPERRAIVALAIGIALPMLSILSLQQQLYGSPFTTGYALLQDGGAPPTEFVSGVLPWWFRMFVAPFGWHPVRALVHAWRYLVAPHLWFVALAAVGMLTSVCRSVGARRAMIGTAVLTAWFLWYYGSWELADSLVRTTNVLTISYVRYWLPLVVLLAPWAAIGIHGITTKASVRWRPVLTALLILGIAFTTTMQVIQDPREGLLRQRQAIAESRVRARAVIAATEPNTIIISHRMDKVFFPERAVIHAPEDPSSNLEFLQRLHALADVAPVSWYAAGMPRLAGFQFTPTGTMPFGEQLARMTR